MLAAALRAEVAAYCAQFADERDDDGHRLVVRNGYHGLREVTTAAGAIEVHAPRVNDKRVDPETVSGRGSRRRSCRRAVGAQDPAGRAGAAAFVPARALVAGLRARRWGSSSARPRACRQRRGPRCAHGRDTSLRSAASSRNWRTAVRALIHRAAALSFRFTDIPRCL